MEKKRVSVWQKLGIETDEEKVLHFPFRYEDETQLYNLNEAAQQKGAVCLDLLILGKTIRYGSRMQVLVEAVDSCNQTVQIRFFNLYPSQMRLLEKDVLLRVFGEVRQGLFGFEMLHPRFVVAQAPLPLKTTLTPIYPTTAGLSQNLLQSSIAAALNRIKRTAFLKEVLPEDFLKKHQLPTFAHALLFLHAPDAHADPLTLENRTHAAWQRIKLDELLSQQISLQKALQNRKKEKAPVLAKESPTQKALIERLPFTLTDSQQSVLAEMSEDLSRCYPMHRLLQGDVGSGKTIVAALAICQCVDSGFSAALMAPTEILAEQHAHQFTKWLQNLGVSVVLLLGGQNAKTRRAELDKANNPKVLFVGTHALIQETVAMQRLGLVVIDEQHRFGVAQRLALRNKGEFVHQLMMSATPIPRTLAMSCYADLDISTMLELPQGRKPIQTRLIKIGRRDEVIAFVAKKAALGHQIYWVCPLVDESEKLSLQAAMTTEEELRAKLPQFAIALLHGRQKSAQKEAIMRSFVAGEVQILVATTVIEVGVNVPNASLMVIDHAERFGLTQLHQLRGRVGRGHVESQCILLYAEPLSDLAKARLKIIFENSDGFQIANEDLKLRGPGELIGQKQSGMAIFRYANLSEDVGLLEWAKYWAADLLNRTQEAQIVLSRWQGNQERFLKV